MEAQDVGAKRKEIGRLLSSTDPADALASYYALWHDPHRTTLRLHYDSQERVDGFVAVCQTGADLFRPLVTLRAPDEGAVQALLRSGLAPGRPYRVVVPERLASAVRTAFDVGRSSLNRVLVLNAARFQPVINVLVQRSLGPDGEVRFQIESQGEVMALSGTNWRSPFFAEVFVYVHPRARGRGWGKSVVSSTTAALLQDRLRPLYMADVTNESSLRLAEGLGYEETGAREFSAEGRLITEA